MYYRMALLLFVLSGQNALSQESENLSVSDAECHMLPTQNEDWEGRHNGEALDSEKLNEQICQHHQASTTIDEGGALLSLDGADLEDVNLEGVRLIGIHIPWARGRVVGASFAEADLSGANFRNASLNGAMFQGATMTNADLRNATLAGADFQGAWLRNAKLQGADLRDSDLGRANLQNAQLQRSNLVLVSLSGAEIRGATLHGARFEPRTNDTLDRAAWSTVNGLHALRYESFPDGLMELRNAFRDGGYRAQERDVTYAIRRSEREVALRDGRWFDAAFWYVCCEITVSYGRTPARALGVMGGLIPLFAIAYAFFLAGSRTGAIWRIPDPDCPPEHRGPSAPERVAARGWYGLAGWSLYFSLLSAFHIGWRDLNVGNWIVRLQSHPYYLQATGVPRVLSGVQSLLSVFLLALWVLSYFGRPFG